LRIWPAKDWISLAVSRNLASKNGNITTNHWLARSPIRLPPNQDKLIERKRRPMQNASRREISHRDKKKTIIIHECNHQKLGSTNRNLHGFNMELNKIWATTWYMMETQWISLGAWWVDDISVIGCCQHPPGAS
jgi:hypothetical protein